MEPPQREGQHAVEVIDNTNPVDDTTIANERLLDHKARKRIQNRVAQRSYRQRMKARVEELQAKVEQLEGTRHDQVPPHQQTQQQFHQHLQQQHQQHQQSQQTPSQQLTPSSATISPNMSHRSSDQTIVPVANLMVASTKSEDDRPPEAISSVEELYHHSQHQHHQAQQHHAMHTPRMHSYDGSQTSSRETSDYSGLEHLDFPTTRSMSEQDFWNPRGHHPFDFLPADVLAGAIQAGTSSSSSNTMPTTTTNTSVSSGATSPLSALLATSDRGGTNFDAFLPPQSVINAAMTNSVTHTRPSSGHDSVHPSASNAPTVNSVGSSHGGGNNSGTSLEERLVYVAQHAGQVGFEDLDAVIVAYYSLLTGQGSEALTSRRGGGRRLPRVIASLRYAMLQWREWEQQGFPLD